MSGRFAKIAERTCMYEDPNGLGFLHYMIQIEGREGMYAGYDDDMEIEAGPVPKIRGRES
jgi:hypothetical protein